MLKSLFNKIAGILTCNYIKKKTSAQVFSCEFSEIFKNTFFTEYLRAAASGYQLNARKFPEKKTYIKFYFRILMIRLCLCQLLYLAHCKTFLHRYIWFGNTSEMTPKMTVWWWNFPVITGYVIDIYSNTLLSIWKEIRISDRQKQSFADVPQNRCSLKFREFYRKTLVLEALFKKGQAWRPATLLKETPKQVFSCKICEIVKGYYLCYETIFCHKVTLDVTIFFLLEEKQCFALEISRFLWFCEICRF